MADITYKVRCLTTTFELYTHVRRLGLSDDPRSREEDDVGFLFQTSKEDLTNEIKGTQSVVRNSMRMEFEPVSQVKVIDIRCKL